jgi:hypothetical protein
MEGATIETKSKVFVNRAKNEGNDWIFNNILRFMQFQLDRANRKEIPGSIIRNYLKSIKLFCEMADFSIAWKKMSRCLSRAKKLFR